METNKLTPEEIKRRQRKAGKDRWKGITKEERSKQMTDLIKRRWDKKSLGPAFADNISKNK